MKNFLGVDIGSSSVKIAVIDEDNNLLDSVYLKNKGLINSLKEAFSSIDDNFEISGVGCTGSGRQFVKLLIGADITKTEILAHGIGALSYYPNALTVCDIGAEDSKIISVIDGNLNNFIMNSSCSAGCGAMLEAIATRIGIKIEDVGDIALQSKNTVEIPAKCGVFAQSAVITMLNKGIDKSDILMGVCRGLVRNYLFMAKNVDLKPPYIFCGMTAKNNALVKALEQELNSKVIVPKYCELMGAIGIAIMAKESKIDKTIFRGFKIKNSEFETKNFRCDGCTNNCEITQAYENKNYIGSMGSRCGKWNNKERK